MNSVIINADHLILGAKILFDHKSEFEAYISGTEYIMSVKMMKEYSKLGLKESKDLIDLYKSGKLKPGPDIKKERADKLERLEKIPFIEELIEKIKSLNLDDFNNILNSLSLSDLIIIDEIIEKEKIKQFK